MNILVVRIGRMGDVLMTLPALHEIFTKFPDAKIDILTSPDGVRVFSLLKERLNNVWSFRNNSMHRIGDARRLARIFDSFHYDRVYCLESKNRNLSEQSRRASSWLNELASLSSLDNYYNLILI